jgi:ABC-type amino acid transport substrate-binding protein
MSPRSVILSLLLALALAAGGAHAAGKKSTLGIFLPTTMADGQERFRLGEELAGKLSEALGEPVVAKSFGRYEDFAKAARSGGLDFAVADAWAIVPLDANPVAMAVRSGTSDERWAIISEMRGAVKDLQGKKLAVTKGAGPADVRFVSNVVFGGDLDAQRHFKLVPVPNVESALKALEAKSADAALVPVSHVPSGTRVLYRSSPQPGAAFLLFKKRDAQEVVAGLKKAGAVGPFSAFGPVGPDSLDDFNRRVVRGPPKRLPVITESPVLRPQTDALVRLGEVGLVMPSFIDDLDVGAEQPDD